MPKEPPAGVDDAVLARERLQAVGFIASLISHPVRNRLAALRSALELLEAGLEEHLSQEHRTLLLHEFDSFIGDFNLGIDTIRSDFGLLEPVSAREVLADALKAYRPVTDRLGILVATEWAHESDWIRADRVLLRQTLLNLLRNSTEALNGAAAPKIILRSWNEEGHLVIEVSDNGPGVPVDFLKRLFIEPVTGRPGGIGLGLPLCRDAMTLMRGSIQYLPAKEAPGACFRLSVPLETAGRR